MTVSPEWVDVEGIEMNDQAQFKQLSIGPSESDNRISTCTYGTHDTTKSGVAFPKNVEWPILLRNAWSA
jgi:hypothetical protein